MPPKIRIFWQRLTSSIALWTIVLIGLFAPKPALAQSIFFVILSFLGILAFHEYAQMSRRFGHPIMILPAMIAGIVLLIFESFAQKSFVQNILFKIFKNFGEPIILIPTLLFFCLTIMKLRSPTLPLSSLAATLFGWFYVFWMLMFIARIYHFPNAKGSWLLFYFILVVKFSDLGAYVTGALWGKHPMAKSISPGKTWEGFVGAIMISISVSMLAFWLVSDHLAPLHFHDAFALGGLLGGLAVVGDLIESLIKREAGVKDSGTLFSGIGGSLDLLDSLLFCAPFFYFYCQFSQAE